MNAATLRLHVFLMGLLALLIGFTSYWSVIDAEDLEENIANRRPLIEEQRIARGDIRSLDGELIARSRRRGGGGLYVRSYPGGALFGHPVGYSYIERGRSGLEQSLNDLLTGEANEFASIIDELEGQQRRGNDVTVTLDSEAQRVASSSLSSEPGAVVAIEPATGAIRAMVTSPTYDPGAIPDQFAQLSQAEGSPLFNRTTQAGYQPGSAMKVVTAAAALDSGEYEPDSTIDGSSPAEISGAPLSNFGGQSFGQIPLTTALTNSVNTAWARVAEDLGSETILEYMERFGFGSDPPLDYPDEEMRASGVYEGDRLLDSGDALDIGRVAIGQERIQVTPLQMAMVAATVANGGLLMRPALLQEAEDPDGRAVEELRPRALRRVISEESAAELTEMMANVVREGTGTAAALAGIEVAGKTGTAEIDIANGINQAWFIGFAPVDDPQIAVAVTVERTTGTGGTVAGPIARDVMQALVG